MDTRLGAPPGRPGSPLLLDRELTVSFWQHGQTVERRLEQQQERRGSQSRMVCLKKKQGFRLQLPGPLMRKETTGRGAVAQP